MVLWDKFKEIDKKFSWSFLGFLIGVLGICMAFYTSFFQDNSPRLKYEILTNTNIIDVKENISKVEILYNGSSISKNDSKLRIMTFKVSNNGNKDILKGEYDKENLLGFELLNGEIIETPVLLNASDKYLLSNLKIYSKSQNSFTFSDVIFEKGAFFIIKVLVLSNKDAIPQLVPLGKIAGVKEINVSENITNRDEPGFWPSLLYGNILIHVARFLLYIFVFILVSLVVFLPISLISDKITVRKKNRIISKFKGSSRYNQDNKYSIIFKIYLDEGESTLHKLRIVLSNKTSLQSFIYKAKVYEDSDVAPARMRIHDEAKENDDLEISDDYSVPRDLHPRLYSFDVLIPIIHNLLKQEIIKVSENDIKVDEAFATYLNIFTEYIEIFK